MRPGTDVTLVSFSKMVGFCKEAAEELAKEGISAEVVNLRSLRPLDRDAIAASARKTNRVVVVEEGWPQAGVGAEISAMVNEDAFDYLDAPVERITGVDIPMPYAANLEKLALPQVSDTNASGTYSDGRRPGRRAKRMDALRNAGSRENRPVPSGLRLQTGQTALLVVHLE